MIRARREVDVADAVLVHRQGEAGVELEHVVRDARLDGAHTPERATSLLHDLEADELEHVVAAFRRRAGDPRRERSARRRGRRGGRAGSRGGRRRASTRRRVASSPPTTSIGADREAAPDPRSPARRRTSRRARAACRRGRPDEAVARRRVTRRSRAARGGRTALQPPADERAQRLHHPPAPPDHLPASSSATCSRSRASPSESSSSTRTASGSSTSSSREQTRSAASGHRASAPMFLRLEQARDRLARAARPSRASP